MFIRHEIVGSLLTTDHEKIYWDRIDTQGVTQKSPDEKRPNWVLLPFPKTNGWRAPK